MTLASTPRRRGAAVLATTALVAGLAALVPSTAHAAGAPANDDFVNAQVITGAAGAAVGYANNTHATVQPGEGMPGDHHANQTVWFSWTAPSGGPVTFSTAGSAFDTVESVYTLSGKTLVPAGVDDDYTGPTSTVPVVAVAGTTYFVQVGGYSFGEQGVLDVSVDPVASGVQGIVKTASGAPIAGACVTDGNNPGDSAVTNAAGWYVIAQPGGTTNTTSATNCLGIANLAAPATAPSSTSGSDGPNTSAPIIGTTGGSLSGRVITPSGAPVGGAYVYISGSGLSSVTVMTDAAGRYTASGLLAGSYTVEGYDNDFNLYDDTLASTVPVPGSGTASAPDLTVHALAGVAGHVTKADGTNYASACITFTTGATSTNVTADSSGNYTKQLPPGTYQVSFNDNCVSPLTYIWFNGAHTAAGATPVTLTVGVELRGVSGSFVGGGTAVAAPTPSINGSPFVSPACASDRAALTAAGSRAASANAANAAAQATLAKATLAYAKAQKQLKKAKKRHAPSSVIKRLTKLVKTTRKALGQDAAAAAAAAAAANAAAAASAAASAAVGSAC